MTSKTILVLVIAAAFVAGTLTTGTMVFAAEDFKDRCENKLEKNNFKGHVCRGLLDLQTQIDHIQAGPPGPPGNDGTNGMDGQNGLPGADGSSCSIDGTIVSCTDETEFDVQGPPGEDGMDGEDGTQIFGTYIVQGGQKFLDVDPTGQGSDTSIIFCQDGDILLSGGYSGLTNVRITENFPHPDTLLGAWVVTANAFEITPSQAVSTYGAFALCMDTTP